MKNTTTNFYLHFLFIFITFTSFSQEKTIVIDTLAKEQKHRFELNLDLASRYIWRGQPWGGNYLVVQPTINYFCTDKLTFGVWATTNFKKDYYFPDGVTYYKGYQELDFSVKYQLNKFLAVQVWDYYYPSVQKIEGIDNSFFNFKNNGTQTVDATLLLDFSDYKLPLSATISTLVAGNDYRYDSDGENPKQNFTTYLELAYTWEDVFKKIQLYPYAGAVLNNQAKYYTYGDYNKVSLVDVGIKVSREFELGKGITMPLWLNYVHNAAGSNTETFGKDFLVAGLTFNYLCSKR